MAYGQIDPARLHGEALRRWYERSSAEVEQEREATAALEHEMFFGGLRPRDQRASTARPMRLAATARPQSENLPKPTPATWVSCHDLLPPGYLPPLLGPFPLRPGSIPILRDVAGAASGGGREPDRKHCEAQENNDRATCSQQPTEQAKAVCYSKVAERRYNCDQFDRLDDPRLPTARRKSGGPWP